MKGVDGIPQRLSEDLSPGGGHFKHSRYYPYASYDPETWIDGKGVPFFERFFQWNMGKVFRWNIGLSIALFTIIVTVKIYEHYC
jgi:hypothetical protein